MNIQTVSYNAPKYSGLSLKTNPNFEGGGKQILQNVTKNNVAKTGLAALGATMLALLGLNRDKSSVAENTKIDTNSIINPNSEIFDNGHKIAYANYEENIFVKLPEGSKIQIGDSIVETKQGDVVIKDKNGKLSVQSAKELLCELRKGRFLMYRIPYEGKKELLNAMGIEMTRLTRYINSWDHDQEVNIDFKMNDEEYHCLYCDKQAAMSANPDWALTEIIYKHDNPKLLLKGPSNAAKPSDIYSSSGVFTEFDI